MSLLNFFNFKKNREWRKNHILYWKNPLELDDSGFSFFQIELCSKLEEILKNNSILYLTEISEHVDLNDKHRVVKMICLVLNDKSKFWIYHDMGDFIINNEHQIYEEWGYLRPEDLINEYLKSAKELLNLK